MNRFKGRKMTAQGGGAHVFARNGRDRLLEFVTI